MNDLISNAPELHIVGVVQGQGPNNYKTLSERYFTTHTAAQKVPKASPIVQDQILER